MEKFNCSGRSHPLPPSLLEKSAAVVDAVGLGELNRLARELLELLQNAVRTR